MRLSNTFSSPTCRGGCCRGYRVCGGHECDKEAQKRDRSTLPTYGAHREVSEMEKRVGEKVDYSLYLLGITDAGLPVSNCSVYRAPNVLSKAHRTVQYNLLTGQYKKQYSHGLGKKPVREHP